MNPLVPAELYRQFLENLPLACVDIAIVANGSVLLVKRKDPPARGEWWLPGGRVRKGERMRDAARRKAAEEVGVSCHVGPLLYTAETMFPDGPHGVAVHSINSCFMLYPAEAVPVPEVRLDEHHLGWKWVNSIPDGLHPYVVKCLLASGLCD